MAIKVAPDNAYAQAYAYQLRGNAYRCKREYDKAIEDYNTAIKLMPDFANTYYNRGFAYFHIDEYQKSWEDIQKAESMGCEIDKKFLKALNQALKG
ncbi:MAG: tetratricopeptide repeat protein [Candidatus Xenobiia bacterium LiM19]